MKTTFVIDEDDSDYVKLYAKRKGFNSVAALSRFALYKYIDRYPLKQLEGWSPRSKEGKRNGG
jgi:hypothetical protein